MIVYVETNFVLELGLRQEQVAGCEKLLTGHRIDLRIPAVCLIEPYFALGGRLKTAKDVTRSTSSWLRDLGRSPRFSSRASELDRQLSALIADATDLNREHIDGALQTIVDRARVIDLSVNIMKAAKELQSQFPSVEMLDSFVLASIILDLEVHQGDRPKLFVTRDKRSVSEQQLQTVFADKNCLLMHNFNDAAEYVKAHAD